MLGACDRSHVVEQDVLAALDGLLWLRTGDAVAERLGISQPSVSRMARCCLRLFDIKGHKLDGEWDLIGNEPLLTAERRVHQIARWMGHRPLRLEATYWSGPLLCTPVPEGWTLGQCNIVGVQRNWELLRERIVDVWLAGRPDLPDPNDPHLTSLCLSHMPVHCLVGEGHPCWIGPPSALPIWPLFRAWRCRPGPTRTLNRRCARSGSGAHRCG